MINIKNLIVGGLLLMAGMGANAQELNCQVTVNGQKVTDMDPAIFTTMQTAISDFMNMRAWTSDVFTPEEKIECSMFFFLEPTGVQDVYNARVTVQSSRPVFNSSYSTPLFNFVDNSVQITYAMNQPIEFNATQYTSNLTSILSFYAYIIIGLDYESFGKGGGAKYFAMAEQIMNNVPTNAVDAKGWRPFDGLRSRYFLINNIMASKYELFRQAMYDYHYAGMDNFYDKPALARQNIMNALDKMDRIAKENPNAILVNVFFQAKSDELVSIFSGADGGEKTKALNYLRRSDPVNASKYEKIIRN